LIKKQNILPVIKIQNNLLAAYYSVMGINKKQLFNGQT